MARQVYMCVYMKPALHILLQAGTQNPKTLSYRIKNTARKQQQRLRSTQTALIVTCGVPIPLFFKRMHNVHTLQRQLRPMARTRVFSQISVLFLRYM